MRRTGNVGVLLLAAVCIAALPTSAATAQSSGVPQEFDQDLVAAGLLSSHPDILYRNFGMDLLGRGHHERGMKALLRAASYSDKPSQAIIAEAYLEGRFGLHRDPATAYVWMDMAAERGYPELVVLREKYWANLTAAERSQALASGSSIYTRYGDEVARPKLARVLRRGMREVTGSRTGFGGNVTIVGPLLEGGSGAPSASDDAAAVPSTRIPGGKFYHSSLWQPQQYFRQQDMDWKERVGPTLFSQVRVGRPVMDRP